MREAVWNRQEELFIKRGKVGNKGVMTVLCHICSNIGEQSKCIWETNLTMLGP